MDKFNKLRQIADDLFRWVTIGSTKKGTVEIIFSDKKEVKEEPYGMCPACGTEFYLESFTRCKETVTKDLEAKALSEEKWAQHYFKKWNDLEEEHRTLQFKYSVLELEFNKLKKETK